MRSQYRNYVAMPLLLLGIFLACLTMTFFDGTVSANSAVFNPIPNPAPNGDSFALEGKIDGPAPTQGATITTPSSGQAFTETPITVAGSCPKDLLVQILVNDAMAGSVYCATGSFSLQVSLVTGQNDIKARVFDDLDQQGPDSNTVSVTFNNARFTAFGTLVTLTSNFSRRAAAPGSQLTWPLILSGGTGPYAFSINWGDGTQPDLQSQSVAGNVNIQHVYKNSGVYQVVVKVSDANGVSAFLQLTAVATGEPTAGVTKTTDNGVTVTTTKKVILWQPAVVLFVAAIAAFWLGRRYELSALRRQIERDAEKYTS